MRQSLSNREKILVTARALFVLHGFVGTSVGQIAKQAGVTHSLLFHHFKNKENLWVAVKERIAQEGQPIAEVLPSSELPFTEFLKQLVHNGVALYRQNPELLRMINWQRLDALKEPKIGVTLSDTFQTWITVFKVYQKQGQIRSEFQPEFIIVMLLAILSSAAMDNYVFMAEKDGMGTYLDFVYASMLKVLQG